MEWNDMVAPLFWPGGRNGGGDIIIPFREVRMSHQLTAKPGTPEFLRQLLEIAQGSDHPVDRAIAKVLLKQLEEDEAAEVEAEGDHES